MRCLERTPPLIVPFVERSVSPGGRSFGLSSASYDVRIDQDVAVPPHGFVLASTIERFSMPDDLIGTVRDKSSWARLGLAVQNTLLDPGWPGYLTLELSNHSDGEIQIERGEPIAQIVFELLDQPTAQPYRGKYFNQERGPQPARHERRGGGAIGSNQGGEHQCSRASQAIREHHPGGASQTAREHQAPGASQPGREHHDRRASHGRRERQEARASQAM
jgi:dCTP deaminase